MAVVSDIVTGALSKQAKEVGVTSAKVKTIKDQVGTESLYNEALEDETDSLYNTEDYVYSRTDINPTMHALASVGRSLDVGESEQVKATNYGKAFLSGVTLNNYDYTPDDMWSAEGVTKMIGEVAPFYLLWQTGAVVSGRAVAALNYAMGGKRTQAAVAAAKKAGQFQSRNTQSANPFLKAGKLAPENAAIAKSFQETWAGFIPQVGIEAGLWTGIDPTLEGAEGFKTAVAYTALGQTLGIGLNKYFLQRGIKQKKSKVLETKGTDTETIDDAVESLVKTQENEEVNILQQKIEDKISTIDNHKKNVESKSNELTGELLKTDEPEKMIAKVEEDISYKTPEQLQEEMTDTIGRAIEPDQVQSLTPTPTPITVQKIIDKTWTVDIPKTNPKTLHVFGDNAAEVGSGPFSGSAVVRNNDNALGIVTKKSPKEFYTDADYDTVAELIEGNLAKIEEAMASGKYNRLEYVPLGTDKAKIKNSGNTKRLYKLLRDTEKRLAKTDWASLKAIEGPLPDPKPKALDTLDTEIIKRTNPFDQKVSDNLRVIKIGNEYVSINSRDIPAKLRNSLDAEVGAPGKTLEVSTKGDAFGKQYSAFNAKFKTGRYKGQTSKGNTGKYKGETSAEAMKNLKQEGYLGIRLSDTIEDVIQRKSGKATQEDYRKLWKEWFNQHPAEFKDIQAQLRAGTVLKDSLATKGRINQADIITDIVRKLDAPKPIKITHAYTKGTIDGKNTNQLIAEGLRTQTTRNDRVFKAKAGDILESTGGGITEYLQVTKVTKGYNLKDFAKQGYVSEAAYKQAVKGSAKGKTTYDFVRVDNPDIAGQVKDVFVDYSKLAVEDQAEIQKIIKSKKVSYIESSTAVDNQGGFDNPLLVNHDINVESGKDIRDGLGNTMPDFSVKITPSTLVPVKFTELHMKVRKLDTKVVINGVTLPKGKEHLANILKTSTGDEAAKLTAIYGRFTEDVLVPPTGIQINTVQVWSDGADKYVSRPFDIVDLAVGEHVLKQVLDASNRVRAKVQKNIDVLLNPADPIAAKVKGIKKGSVQGVEGEVPITVYEPGKKPSIGDKDAVLDVIRNSQTSSKSRSVVDTTGMYSRAVGGDSTNPTILRKIVEHRAEAIDEYIGKVNSVDDRNKIAHFIFKSLGKHTNDYMIVGTKGTEVSATQRLITNEAAQKTYIKKGYDNLSVDEKAYFLKRYKQLVKQYERQVGTELDSLQESFGISRDKFQSVLHKDKLIGKEEYDVMVAKSQNAQSLEVLRDTEDIVRYLEDNLGIQTRKPITTNTKYKQQEGTFDPAIHYNKNNEFVLENLGWNKSFSNMSANKRQVVEDVYYGIKHRHNKKSNPTPRESLVGLATSLEFQGMGKAANRITRLLEGTTPSSSPIVSTKWPEAMKKLKQEGYLDLGEMSEAIVGSYKGKNARLHLVLFDETIRNSKFKGSVMESIQFIPVLEKSQNMQTAVNTFYKSRGAAVKTMKKNLRATLEKERRFVKEVDADGKPTGKLTNVEISTKRNKDLRRRLDTKQVTSADLGYVEAYKSVDNQTEAILSGPTQSFHARSNPAFRFKNTPVTKELVQMLQEELTNFFSTGGHGNLDPGIIQMNFNSMLKKKGIDVKKLPTNTTNTVPIQKQRVRDFIDNLHKQAAAVSLGIKDGSAKNIILKQKVTKQLVKNMDEYTGYDSKLLEKETTELQQMLMEYRDLLNKNNLMESGSEQSLHKVITGMDGLDTLLKNGAINSKQSRYIIDDGVSHILKEQKTGVRKQSKYPVNNIDLDKLKKDIESIFNLRKSIQEFDDVVLDNPTILKVQTPEMKATISGQFSKLIKNDIASWMQDGVMGIKPGMLQGSNEQLLFKQRFKAALDTNDTTAQASIQEEFIRYLTGNERAFLRIAQELNYINRFPTELYYLHRASQGLEPNLVKAKYFREATEDLNSIQMSKLMDNLEHVDTTGHPESNYIADKATINREEGIPPGPTGDSPAITQGSTGETFSPIGEYFWLDPKRQFAKLFKRYGDPVFLSVVDNMQYASRALNDFLNIGDTQFIKGPSMKKVIFEEQDGMAIYKDQLIADSKFPKINNEDNFEELVATPALNFWKVSHQKMSDLASDHYFMFKREVMATGLWKEADEISFGDFVRRTTSDDPIYRVPKVSELMREYLLGNDSLLYKAQKKDGDFLLKTFGQQAGNEAPAEYLRRVQSNLRTVRDTVTNQGRKEANDYLNSLRSKNLISKEQHKLMERKMVGDIPGYMPMFVDGPILIQIKHYKLDKMGVRRLDKIDNVGTTQNPRDAGDRVNEWMGSGETQRYGEVYDESIIQLTIMNNKSVIPPGSNATDELDMIATTSLGNLKKFIQTNSLIKGFDNAKISEYIGSHSMQRQFDSNIITSNKSIEEMVQRYAYSQAKDGFFAKSLAELEYAKSIADKNGHIHTKEYLDRWGNGSLGKKTNFESGVDDTINKILLGMQKFPKVAAVLDSMGMSPGTNRFRSLVGAITKSSSFVALGFNPATALLQLTIAGTNILPLVGFRNMTRAYGKINKVMNPPKGGHKTLDMQNYEYIFDYLDLRGLKNDGTIQGIYQNANQPLVKNNDGFVQKARQGKYKEAGSEAARATMNLSMWGFHKADRMPRMIAAIASRDMANDILESIYKKMRKDGFAEDPFNYLKFNERIMYEKMQRLGLTSKDKVRALDSGVLNRLKNDFAIDFTNATNHSYNATHVPIGFTETGLRPFLQFKTWVQKQTMFWFNIIGDRPTKAGLKEQYEDLMYVTGAMVALGGIFSLPGTQETDAVMRFAFGVSPKAWIMEQDSTILDLMTSGMAMGAGISLEGRMGPGNLTTTVQPENAFGIYPARLFKAGGALWKGNPERAINYTLPKALQNLRSGFTMAATGELRGTYDRNLLLDYNKLEDNKYYAAMLTTIGFESMEESRYKNLKFALLDKSRFTGRQRAWTKTEIFDLINENKVGEAKELTKLSNMKWPNIIKLYKNKYLKQEVETFNYAYSDQNPGIKEGKDALQRHIKSLE